MKTYSLKAKEINNDWHVLDASGQTLGRLATQAARLLMGKHKPTYSPHLPMGDYVVIVNAANIRVTGKKLTDKIYYRHSGYMGGLKATTLREMMARKPERAIELAVKRMLPQNRLGRALFRRLKVYASPEHPHEAQVKASYRRRGLAWEKAAEGGSKEPSRTEVVAQTEEHSDGDVEERQE